MTRDFEKMAKKREAEASKITDLDVWKSVVSKAIELRVDATVKADILLQAIPDIGVIFAQLKHHNNSGNLTDKEYHDILKICVEILETKMGIVDFDPLKYDED